MPWIDLAKDLYRPKKHINQKLKQWTNLQKEEDAISKRTWQCFKQPVIKTLGDLSYLTHKLKNENKKKLIDSLKWNYFTSPHYDLQNFEDKDNAFDLSELHENETFSVVDIMFYHGETIYNTESMLSIVSTSMTTMKGGVHRNQRETQEELSFIHQNLWVKKVS